MLTTFAGSNPRRPSHTILLVLYFHTLIIVPFYDTVAYYEPFFRSKHTYAISFVCGVCYPPVVNNNVRFFVDTPTQCTSLFGFTQQGNVMVRID